MKKYFQKLLSLSNRGASDLMKAVVWCVICDFTLIATMALIFIYLQDTLIPTLNGAAPVFRYSLYIGFGLVLFVLMLVFYKIQYHALYVRVYNESATKRISLAEHLRKLPLSFFSKKDLTDLTTTIMGDVTVMEQALSHFVPQLIGSAISSTLMSVAMLIYNPLMGIAVVWVVPVAIAICYFSKRKQYAVNIAAKKNLLSASDKVQEFVENIKDIKANSREDGHLAILKERYSILEKSQMYGEFAVGVRVSLAQSVLKFGIITTALVGLYLLSQGEIDMLTFILFMVATRIYDPLAGVLINIAATFMSLISIDRMGEIENTATQGGRDDVKINNFDIEFKDVDFSYEDGKQVLYKLSFTAKQGEVTALVGPSGGGKSTAIKLASRFWDIQNGAIKLGGENIETIAPEALLEYYSIVFQDVTLFDNTIMENIRIGKKDATDEEVINAAKNANAHDFIMALPDGYNTMVGENGARLSGGERQRLSIARALLKDAPIILLDEATSALDVMTETLLQEALARLTKNKTVIVVAHRMRTIAGADKIVLLKDGRVAETGNHDELIKKNNGLYARMVELQRLSGEWKIR